MGISQKFKPWAAIFCMMSALLFVWKSTWYSTLSRTESLVVIVIGSVIFPLTAFVASFVPILTQRERMDDDWKRRSVKQVVVYVVILYLKDEFGERHPDYMLFGALIFSAFYVHFTAHTFRVLEDYGLSQGFITVAITALVDLANRRLLKMIYKVIGTVLLALYAFFEDWDDGRDDDTHTDRQLQNEQLRHGVPDIEKGGAQATSVRVPYDTNAVSERSEDKVEVEDKREEADDKPTTVRKRMGNMNQDEDEDENKNDSNDGYIHPSEYTREKNE